MTLYYIPRDIGTRQLSHDPGIVPEMIRMAGTLIVEEQSDKIFLRNTATADNKSIWWWPKEALVKVTE